MSFFFVHMYLIFGGGNGFCDNLNFKKRLGFILRNKKAAGL